MERERENVDGSPLSGTIAKTLLATARVDAPAATDAADSPVLHLNAAIKALLNDPELKVAAP